MRSELIAMAGSGLLLVLGAVMLISAALNWGRMCQDWRSRLIIRWLGRDGARLLMGLFGALLAATGLVGLLGGFG